MSTSMHNLIPQPQYAEYLRQTSEFVREFKKSIPAEELAKFERFKNRPRNFQTGIEESEDRQKAARAIMTGLVKGVYSGKLAKAGVTSALGYNFYDLRAPVQLSYPVNVPFRNSLPRIGRVNDGYGTAAHWKATRNPGIVYAGAAEGKRAQIATPDENDYTASYKEIGVERGVTFTAQFAGEGFADNVADEHLRGLHELWLQEEGLMLLGNSGTATGNNGFALGTAGTPTATLAAGGTIPDTTKVTGFVVFLTAMGNPSNSQYGYGVFPTVAGGLTPSYVRNNADGSTDTINGGTSAISAASNSVTCGSGNNKVTFSVPAAQQKKGVFGYAWFVSENASPTTANAYLAAITQFPTYTFDQPDYNAANQAGNATGLNADHSYNQLDFDGLLTYAASTSGAGWTDLRGSGLTSQKNGRVTEIETILQSIWTLYQAGVDEIWGSADAVAELDQAIRYTGTQATSFRFDYARDSQNNLLGGFVVSAYQSRFAMNPNGANAIPIRLHPMIPPGTLYFHIKTNPYPHSRAPFVAGMLVQREYYSIEWPLVTRQWTFGTYAHEVLAHNFPWIPAVLTGIGPFNNSQ